MKVFNQIIRVLIFGVQFVILAYALVTILLGLLFQCRDFKTAAKICEPNLIANFVQANLNLSFIIGAVVFLGIFAILCIFEDKFIFKRK